MLFLLPAGIRCARMQTSGSIRTSTVLFAADDPKATLMVRSEKFVALQPAALFDVFAVPAPRSAQPSQLSAESGSFAERTAG